MLFLFVYIVNGLIAPTIYGASMDFKTTKPILCDFYGNKLNNKRPETPIADASSLPKECEVILLTSFEMNQSSEPLYTEALDQVLQLNRTVFLQVTRSEGYSGWSTILKPDGNEKDAKALTDFAISKGFAGVVVNSITPVMTNDGLDESITKNIIPYLCQLKINNDFIVGVKVEPGQNQLLDSSVINFEAMNPLVDFYIVNSFITQPLCQIALSNGLAPIKSKNGVDGIDTVITQISQTKIANDKVFMVSTVLVVDPDETAEYKSHSEACVTKNDTMKWCIPTTKDYYDKGKFFRDQKYGVVVSFPEFDDVNNSCGCCAFIAVINIAAGYKGEQQIPCAKFDVKDN